MSPMCFMSHLCESNNERKSWAYELINSRLFFLCARCKWITYGMPNEIHRWIKCRHFSIILRRFSIHFKSQINKWNIYLTIERKRKLITKKLNQSSKRLKQTTVVCLSYQIRVPPIFQEKLTKQKRNELNWTQLKWKKNSKR